jgi:hypothetical protein
MSRGGLDFEGLGERFVTKQADTALKAIALASGFAYVEGKAVAVTGNGLVGFGAAGNPLYGRIDKYEDDDYLTVQYGGYAILSGVSGSLPVAGTDFVPVVDGAGAVMASAGAAGKSMIVSVDDTANTVVVLIG